MTKKTLIIGLGLSGRAAAGLLLANGADVTGVDGNLKRLSGNAEFIDLQKQGLKTVSECDWQIADYDFAVLSPGIPLDHAIVCTLTDQGVPVIGEVELALRHWSGRALGITGTNGKTTVTLMVAHCLNEAGIPAYAAGNVGEPISRVVQTAGDAVLILELSSYQLESLSLKCLDGAALLNITPDHLDRYGNMDTYARAKFLIQRNLRAKAPLYIHQPTAVDYASLVTHKPTVTFGLSSDAQLNPYQDLVRVNEKIETILPVRYRGVRNHDVANWLAAYALCRSMKVDPVTFHRAADTFQKPEHRMEFVRKRNGVSYYNDSKGTNIDAVLQGVKSVPGRVILIAGGQAKGSEFLKWRDPFAGKVHGVVAIGEASFQLERELGDLIPVEKAGDMGEAIRQATELAKEGDTVLLSPGCASFDMYDNYAHRGKVFKEMVLTLS